MKKAALALALCTMLTLVCACTQTQNDRAKLMDTPDVTEAATTAVTFSANGKNYSVELPDSWDAQPATLDDGEWGLVLTPKTQPQLSYSLLLYKQMQGFGVCGTGLEEKQTVINGMEANIGYYGGADYWSFISFDCGGVSGSLTWGIDGEGDARQLGIADHNDAAMSILASLTEL